MYLINELFEKDNHFYILDIVSEIKHKELTKQDCIELFNKLPDNTKNIAHCWGLGDSVFRDEAYSFFMKNTNLINAN